MRSGDDAAHVRELVECHRPPNVASERFARSVAAGTVEQHVARVERLVEAGVDHLIVSVVGVEHDGALERWADVAAASRRSVGSAPTDGPRLV